MAEKPILFNGPMVRAILEGRKTQTRRVLKKPKWAQDKGWPERLMEEADLAGRLHWFDRETGCCAPLPLPAPGDALWVRETWRPVGGGPDCYCTSNEHIDFRASPPSDCADDMEADHWDSLYLWRPSIHLPKALSRITLRVTDVRVERVQDISEEDALAEGASLSPNRETNYRVDLPPKNHFGADVVDARKARSCFRALWNSLYAKRGFGWDANPWVAAYTFERVEG